jgi:hypothetical protein
MRVKLIPATIWLLSCMTATVAVAQTPFSGVWKLNQEKSRMAGDIMKFGPAKEDAIELTAGGLTYSFRTDGNTYRLPSGNAAIWRQTGPNSWTTEYRKLDNKLLSRDTWTLSEDGKKLTQTTSGTKADGDVFTDTEEYERVKSHLSLGHLGAGHSGLMGTWKGTAVKLTSPNELTIEETGLDRLILKIASMQATSVLNFDGKEAPVEGPDVPPGLQLSLTRTGPYAFRLVQKLNGTAFNSSVYTVAKDDLNTMTEVGGSPGDPPATVIWEKQAALKPVTPVAAAPTVGAPVRP